MNEIIVDKRHSLVNTGQFVYRLSQERRLQKAYVNQTTLQWKIAAMKISFELFQVKDEKVKLAMEKVMEIHS